MVIYLRRVGEVADGSITDVKLAVGAVDLAGNKVTGELPTANIADGAIVETKLASLAVTTGKLSDNAVTLAKSAAALKRHIYIGDDTEQSVVGVTETEIYTFQMAKSANISEFLKLLVQSEMKTSNALYAATMKIYVDAEVSPRITLTSTSATYELQSDNADISDLTIGKHVIHVKLVSADTGATAYNDMLDVFTEI